MSGKEVVYTSTTADNNIITNTITTATVAALKFIVIRVIKEKV